MCNSELLIFKNRLLSIITTYITASIQGSSSICKDCASGVRENILH